MWDRKCVVLFCFEFKTRVMELQILKLQVNLAKCSIWKGRGTRRGIQRQNSQGEVCQFAAEMMKACDLATIGTINVGNGKGTCTQAGPLQTNIDPYGPLQFPKK